MPPVTYHCGHTGHLSFFPSPQRLETLQRGMCPACWLRTQPTVFTIYADSISVSRGYPLRDQLRAGGYYFHRPIWTKKFSSKGHRDEEIAWIVANGFDITYADQAEKPAEQGEIRSESI